MRVSLTSSGSFKNTESFLQAMTRLDIRRVLENAGREGVAALAAATPTDSGLASDSWTYKISISSRSAAVTWYNTDVESGFPVAIMLQYGYGTGTGGYVQGRDYINPAIQPVMDRLANDVWKEVTSK